jgi:DNA repair exonuclease SbcCD ATPase subunit
LIAIPILLAVGCTDYKQQALDLKKEKENLMASKQNLENDSRYKDSTINSFISSFDEIESSLADITQKQKALRLSVSNNETNANAHALIKEQLNQVKEQMEQNKNKLASLGKQLRNNKAELSKFKSMVDALNEQTVAKDKEIGSLNEKLNTLTAENTQLHTNVESLSVQNTEKDKVIAEKIDKLNTAYFTKGTYKDLHQKHVVEKEGGLLGIGKEKVLTADFNRNEFTAIDITKTNKISLDSKNVEVVTNHPSDSYILNKTADKMVSELVITNPEKFWASSKYLVVLVNN